MAVADERRRMKRRVASGPMKVPFFAAADIEAAVPPEQAVEAVRAAFVAYARGEWSMPPKVYVPAYPAGDFRAMPALGAGHALLKWVTSFPGNPAYGLPTVMGLALLSDAANGALEAVFDAGAITALRTGAAAVLAAETLGRADAETAAVIGAGINGKAAARTFAARGRQPLLWDVDEKRAESAAAEIGGSVATSRDEALAADLVVTVTPGHELLLREGSLRPGQHASLMGADGPGKAEIAVAGVGARSRVLRRLDAGEPQRGSRPCCRGRRAAARRRDRARLRPGRRRGGPTISGRIHGLRLDRPGNPGSGCRTGSVRAGRPARGTCRR